MVMASMMMGRSVVNGQLRARCNATLCSKEVVRGLEQVHCQARRDTTLCGGEVVGRLDCEGYNFGSGLVDARCNSKDIKFTNKSPWSPCMKVQQHIPAGVEFV